MTCKGGAARSEHCVAISFVFGRRGGGDGVGIGVGGTAACGDDIILGTALELMTSPVSIGGRVRVCNDRSQLGGQLLWNQAGVNQAPGHRDSPLIELRASGGAARGRPVPPAFRREIPHCVAKRCRSTTSSLPKLPCTCQESNPESRPQSRPESNPESSRESSRE